MLDLRQIQNFVAVAERLSVSKAALVVNLSQPALSRQMQALEKTLGVMLFERAGKKLMLTAEGDDLLRRAVVLIDQSQALIDRSQKLKQGSVGLLRVGGTSQTIARLLSPVMAEFKSAYPAIDLVLSEADNDGLLEMVERGGVHVAVAALGGAPGLAGTLLFEAEIRIIVPPGHRLAAAESVTIKMLAGENVMTLRRGFLTRQLFDRACAHFGVRPNIILESDSAFTLAALARDGHGIAVVSTSADNIVGSGRTIGLLEAGAPIKGDVYAVWNTNRHRPACLGAFVALLETRAREAHAV